MEDPLSNKDIVELLRHKDDVKITLIYKYCLKHHTTTWHLLCSGGIFSCLECYLEELINDFKPSII